MEKITKVSEKSGRAMRVKPEAGVLFSQNKLEAATIYGLGKTQYYLACLLRIGVK